MADKIKKGAWQRLFFIIWLTSKLKDIKSKQNNFMRAL